MEVEIIGAESLGVRGLCCFVAAGEQRILIDPGMALGFVRHGLAPHPVQVAVAEVVREKILQAWTLATDIVFSHFHGDHVPLADANPYQLDAARVAGLNPGSGSGQNHLNFYLPGNKKEPQPSNNGWTAVGTRGHRALMDCIFPCPCPMAWKQNAAIG